MNRTRLLADVMALLSLLLLVAAEVATAVLAPDALLDDVVSDATFVVGFGGVGWLLSRRLPRNAIGWCFAVAALVGAVTAMARSWAVEGLARQAEPDLVVRLGALTDTFSWVVGVPLALLLPLLLLPDGRLLSPRWRVVLYAEVVGCGLGVVGFLTLPGPIDTNTYRQLDNPLGVTRWADGTGALRTIGSWTLTVGAIAGAVAIVIRFRRSRGVERQQMRWIAFGACCAAVGSAFGGAGGQVLPEGVAVLAAVGLLAVPVCVGVAVLRYRLYDLGRVVSRTVSYAVVTAVLLGLYVTGVTSAARLTPASSSLAVAASTLAVAALFQPLRRRVQTAVDHRFNRARYDADRTVEAYTRRLREEVDLDAVRTDLLQVVHGALQPASVGLWLREASR